MSRRTIVTIAALALGMTASACSSGKSSQRQEESEQAASVEQVQPRTGVITSVDRQRLLIDSAEDPGNEPELFERTTRSVVVDQGSEVAWENLSEGDVVRVTWDRGIFGPDRAAHVEVLTGEEAEQVRAEMEGGTTGDGLGDPLGPREIEPMDDPDEPAQPGISPPGSTPPPDPTRPTF